MSDLSQPGDPLSIGQAESLVAEKRRLLESDGPRQRPELSKALLDLSRAYEGADRGSDALAAAKESVATLAADFLAKPGGLAMLMRGLLSQYVSLAKRSGETPDEALLAPIAQALGDLTRAEDADEES